MSADENGDDGPGRREVARRLFAAEFEDADLQYSESDEERAPNYVVTPSGARVNRLFFVGVLTELEQVNESMLRARIVDPTGAFVAYAGQYQPDELAFLERVEPPTFLAVTGKARTFQPEDSDRIFTSVRPESINEVDAETRDRWVIDAARRTVERIEVATRAIESGRSGEALRASLTDDGIDPSLASGIALALDHYGTTPAYLSALRETALDAARVVADEIEEVGGLSVAPDEGGGASVPGGPSRQASEPVADDADSSGEPDVDAGEPAATGPGAAATTDASATGTDAVGDDSETGGQSVPASDEEPASETTATPEAASAGSDAASADDADPENAPTSDEAGVDSAATVESDEAGAIDDDDAADPDEIGDFEAGEFDAEAAPDAADGDAGLPEDEESFDPDEDVLDPDEREEIEAEFGTDFSTAGDVEAEPDAAPDTGAGAADGTAPEAEASGDGPSAEEAEETAAAASTGDDTGSEDRSTAGTEAGDDAATTDEADGSDAAEAPGEPADPDEDAATGSGGGAVDLETAVLETIESLDDGDGADRETVARRVADEHGASEAEVDDAIEEAMMSGRCYEPADGRVKSI